MLLSFITIVSRCENAQVLELIKIIKILGSPTEDDIKGMNLQKLDMDWMYIMPMKMMKILLN